MLGVAAIDGWDRPASRPVGISNSTAGRGPPAAPWHAYLAPGPGVVYLLTGQYEQTIRTLSDALVLVPKSGGLLSNLTLAYVEAGRFEEAIRTGERLRTVTPGGGDRCAILARLRVCPRWPPCRWPAARRC